MSCACGHHHAPRTGCADGQPVALSPPMIALSGRLICADMAQMMLAMDLLPEHVRLSRAEPGCLRFDIGQDDDPLIWSLSELFTDAAAFQAHQDRNAASVWGRESRDLRRNFDRREVQPVIRAEIAADADAIDDLLTQAFDGPSEAQLVRWLRADGDLPISLVIEAEGTLLGHIALSPLQAERPAYALAPLAVHPKMQGRGLGGALIRAAVAQAGDAAIVLLGDPAYYARFGFRPVDLISAYAGPYLQMLGDLPAQSRIDHAPAFARL